MRSRGRPRKTPVTVARSPVTLAATSRNEEIGTTEVDESDAFDPGAAQPHGEVQSARQTLPRRPKSDFDQAFSEFRSSQILRATCVLEERNGSRSQEFCEHIPEEFRRFRYNDPVEPFDENDQAPEAIAKGSNKLQAKPPKSDDGEEEEEEVEEVEDGSVKILEALKALRTQLEVVSTRLQALEVRLTVAPTADGASCIESDDRLPYHHVGDCGHVTPTQASPEVDGGFTIATPAANHAALDQPALAQGSQFPKPQPAAIQTS
ncbi:hypothetical protein D6D18_08309 [Aureobasidium pullulans]|nr:hypothetical protein D6D18_08309 [Aureobasidium pullulans]